MLPRQRHKNKTFNSRHNDLKLVVYQAKTQQGRYNNGMVKRLFSNRWKLQKSWINIETYCLREALGHIASKFPDFSAGWEICCG